MAKKIKTADDKKSKPESGFSVHGTIRESETGAGIPGLIVEVLDHDKCRDERLVSVLTDKNGRFDLRYEKEDFRQHYFEKQPDLYLQVRTPEGKIVHTTKEKVRYEAGRTEAFPIHLSVIEDLPPDFMEVTFAPARAKKDTPVKVNVKTTPGGNAYFSIFQLPGARRIEMTEDPNKPGFYHGEYIARSGDKIDHTPVAVVYTSKEGKVFSRQADGKISIDTHAPVISRVMLDPSGRYLFQLDAKLEDQLKAGTVSSQLLNTFVRKGIPLQQDARIETQNGFWWVTDRASRYLINRIGDKWRIYEDGFIVRNGESFQLLLRSKPKAQIKVLLTELDTENKKAVLLNENPNSPGEYFAKIKISSSNKAGNGIKRLQISVTDAFGNKGDDLVTSVELVNPEYASFKNIPPEHAALLEKQGIVTFAHLRAMDIQQAAQATGLEPADLRKYQALASIQTIAPNPDVAEALVEHGGYTSAAFMGFVDVDEIMKALEKSAGGGPKQNVAYTNQVAENLSAAGRQLVGMLNEQRIRDQIKPANACGEVCAPESSAFSCFAYLAYLLEKAGFETDKSLRQIFGWNLAAVTTEPVSRIAICLGILRPRININPSHPAQKEYDRLVNNQLIALTGKTEEQLKYDPVYQHIFSAQNLYQQNLWLEQDLMQVNGPIYIDKVKAIRTTLESLELDTLIAQSGKTAEAWREQFYIAFDTRECDKASYCQQAILVMQEYLNRNPQNNSLEKPLLSYDAWHSDQIKLFYPDTYYAFQFKQPLITGERETLKIHLHKAKEILEKVRIIERDNAPSGEDPNTFLNSYRYFDAYYKNFENGIVLIEDCFKVDEMMFRGHQAFFNEEYHLSRLYYFGAARMIREIGKKIRGWEVNQGKRIKIEMPSFLEEEPDITAEILNESDNKTSKYNQTNVNNRTVDWLLKMLSSGLKIFQKIHVYYHLYASYLPTNIPGIGFKKGIIPLRGVDLNGSFLPIKNASSASVLGNFSTDSFTNQFTHAFQTTIKLKSFGWALKNFYSSSLLFLQETSAGNAQISIWVDELQKAPISGVTKISFYGGIYDYWDITEKGELFATTNNNNYPIVNPNPFLPPGPNPSPTPPSNFSYVSGFDHLLAAVYEDGYDLTDYIIEVEVHGASNLQGVAVRWNDQNNYISVTIDSNNGGKLIIGKVTALDPKKRERNIQSLHEERIEYYKSRKYRLVTTVSRKTISCKLSYLDNSTPPNWIDNGEIPVMTIEGLAEKGTVAMLSGGEPGAGAVFEKVTITDLSSAIGAVSDLAFFLKPKRFNRGLMFGYQYPKGEFPDTESAYENRITIPTKAVDQLAIKVSLGYNPNYYIIKEKEADSYNDPLYTGEGVNAPKIGLWYGPNEDQLNRENLRHFLDLAPNLFIHDYFFMLPICLGDVANAMGNYQEASNWYRLVYDEYEQDLKKRPVYIFLNQNIEAPMLLQRIAKNYLDWANHLFRENTKESVHHARLYFKRVLDLLDSQNCCGLKSNDLFKTLMVNLTEHNLPQQKVVSVFEAALDFSGTYSLEHETSNLLKGLNIQFENAKTPSEGLDAATQYLYSEIQKSKQAQKVEVLPLPKQALMTKLGKLEKVYPAVFKQLEQNNRSISSFVQITRNNNPTTVGAGIGQGQNEGISQLLGLTGYQPLPSPGTAVLSNISLETVFSESIINPMLGASAPGFLGQAGGSIAFQPHYPEYRINHDFCLPPNPYDRSMTEQACRGIYLIDHCFNIMGFPQNAVSLFRYEYLVGMAKNYANLAQSAEKDFIQFKEKFEADTLELMNASQSVSLAQGNVQLANLRVQEALDQVRAAAHQVASITGQIAVIERRIDEIGNNGLAIFGAILGMVASVAGAIVSFGASLPGTAVATLASTGTKVVVEKSLSIWGIIGAAGQLAGGIGSGINNLNGIWNNKDALARELEDLRINKLPAARLNSIISIDQLQTVRQQTRIAQLEAQFVAERAAYLTNQFFNPQLWSFLAKEVKKIYRNYLQYGATAAWLAQRALEFEKGIESHRRFAHTFPAQKTGDNGGLGIISQQYFQSSQQGLLAAESLMNDISALEQEKFLNDQRKLQITKTISLAQTRPLDYAHFLETGIIHFGTSLPDFDFDYPGHYQRRIKEVRINLFGLIGPEGIRATLTHLGPSQVVVREWSATESREAFVEKTLNHPLDYQVMTNPLEGGIGKIALSPENPHLRPFEGKGVAGQWIFEMMKMSNPIDFSTITDIQLVIEYTALADPVYRAEVLQRLPTTLTGIRPYSFCVHFSDACFHLKDSSRPIGMIETSDKTTGAHTLMIQTEASDFPPNQRNRRLKEVYLYLQAKDGKLLFVAKDQYSQDLDKGKFTQSLQTEFAVHKITLAQNAPVATKQKGLSWTVTGNQQEFLIVKQGDQIKVFDNSRNYANLKVHLSARQRLAAGSGLTERDLNYLQIPGNPPPPPNSTLLPAETDHTKIDPSPNYLGRWEAKNLGIAGVVGVADTWYIHIPPQDRENIPFIRKNDKGNEMDMDGHKLFDFSDLGDVIFALHYEYDVIKPSI